VSAVLLVANWPSDTGYAWRFIERYWLAIAKDLSSAGRPVLLCYPKITTLSPDIRNSGVQVIEFDFDLSKPRSLVRFVRDYEVTSVYLTDKPHFSVSYLLLKAAGVTAILIHDHTPGERAVPRGIPRVLKAVVAASGLTSAHMYIACSPFVYERMLASSLIPRRSCRLVTNGIDLDQYRGSQMAGPNIRDELGISGDSVLVVSVGRATVFKGISRIIRAAAMLRERNTRLNVRFIHCGDGPDMQVFVDLTRSLHVEDTFRLLGSRTDVAAILQHADIAVHASDGEGLCLAILEFMAAGLPTVVPDIWSVCQSIADEQTGLWYRHDDISSLTDTLERLVIDGALRAELGARAREVAQREYDIETSLKLLVRTVHEAIAT